MAAATFDALKFVEPPGAATQADIPLVRKDMDAMELRLRAELTLLKWMTGLILAGVFSLVLTSFF